MASKKVKRITSIKEIANLAGCSIATVSNTLNNKGRISKEVRERIFKICRKHGYLPNSAGRNLRRRRNETIGLLFYPSCAAIFRNIYYAEIMEALEAAMEVHGYDLLLTGYDSSVNASEPPRIVRQGKVDGIILLGGFPRKIVRTLTTFGMPLLHLDSHRKAIRIDHVTTDGFSASEQIVNHLVMLGHRRIVFMAHSHEDTNADQREAGFLNAVKTHRLPKTISVSIRNFTCTADGYPILKDMLKSNRAPTAVICVNDTLAEQLIRCLKKDKFKIPRDLTVFGFNDDLDSQRSTPTISTVRVDKTELGRIGAETILNRIENPEAPVVSVNLPVQLVHRQSEGPPRP